MTALVQDPGRVRDLSVAIATGGLTPEDLVERCLFRIAAVDGQVQAWLHVEAEGARAAGRALDAERRHTGVVRGRLHGIPVAVKDVIDVAGLPTRANSPSRADAPPATADATVVAHLRAAGAIVLGKVHTTEYAYFQSVPPTRNPHDLSRTPGGSSAGSGAAVAAGMVPLALGTQTAGSVNRPAAYTGVGAFKPSTLAVGGAGVLSLAPSFDTVGAFGATAQDAAYLAAGYAADHLGLADAPGLAVAPRIVVLEDPLIAGRVAPATARCVAALADRRVDAGLQVPRAESPIALDKVLAAHRLVMMAELGRTHARLPKNRIAPKLAEDIEAGLAIPDTDYFAGLRALAAFRRSFWAGFGPEDLLLMPAAPDVAPAADTTGDPSFIIPTTALGGPVASLRAGTATDSRMPVGALLFGAPGADARLAAFLLSDTGTRLDL